MSDYTTGFLGANRNENEGLSKEKEETIIIVFVVLLGVLVFVDLVLFIVYLVRRECYADERDEVYETYS